MPENTKTKLDEYFEDTTTRNPDGRYIVKLPRKTENADQQLGLSKTIAAARLLSLEKSFNKNPTLATEYKKFLKEF